MSLSMPFCVRQWCYQTSVYHQRFNQSYHQRVNNHLRIVRSGQPKMPVPVATRHTQSGFTLVEIAIVLVIVGLILGGVMKGQALIDNARVRSLATDVSGIQTAWYSFQDRYRSYPGDFPNASAQIDSAAKSGNGNGKIDDDQERASVWQQLSLAGFITGNFDGSGASAGTATDVDCSESTCPRNPFNGFYKVSYGAQA